MGEKWRNMEIPIFHSPISPMFPEMEDLTHSFLSIGECSFTALTDGNMGNCSTL